MTTRILIIDDELWIRRALSDYLEECGYETEMAAHGREGLEKARAAHFDLVLVDLRMPYVDGLEVVTTLKEEQPTMPVVVVSGTGVLQDVISAIRRGAWDYVTKPIHDMDEIMVVVERVLERAQLIAERDRYQQELEHLTAELREALEQARSADRAKSQFLSNVSHELRTPLTSIRLYLGLLANCPVERRETYLESLSRETGRLQTLIEGLLDISRLDLGKTTAKLEPTDLNQLLSTLFNDREKLFAERGLRLQLQTAANLPPTQADPRLIEQVATNLLTNAMNYTPIGGEVSLHTAIVEAEERPWVTFSVQDTGPGIAEEELPHLFNRFFRGQAGQTSKAAGTGLGLAICKEIVTLHDGRITLDSVVGQGCTFTVWLPQREA
ncbi:MAG TPA: hybrid sensor histidine kinase/response regulator [Anaerolineae bacterium]|nr:hybrid sensor histidine kinase/response regulator [Anaerolineae bacterium]